MPYTMEDFKRDSAQELLNELTPEQRLKGLSPEQLLSVVPLAEIEKYIKKHKAAQNKDAPEQPDKPS
jgi:hypothetical protein